MDNVFLLLIDFSGPSLPPITFSVLNKPMPCLVRADCLFCLDVADARKKTDPKHFNYFAIANQTVYGTYLSYVCPIGSQFVTADPDVTVPTTEMSCGWNGTWSPIDQLPACKGSSIIRTHWLFRTKPFMPMLLSIVAIGCVNPRVPLPGQRMLLDPSYVEDDIVSFGHNLSYSCVPFTFFDHDKDLEEFVITCQEDGTWTNDGAELYCQSESERTCSSDPPEPHYNGGVREWPGGGRVYGQEVKYSCGMGRQILDAASGTTSSEPTKVTCTWARGWTIDHVGGRIIIVSLRDFHNIPL